MHVRDGEFALSATDLSSFLGCRHRTALDMSVALGKREPVYQNDPLLDLLVQRGLDHERRFVDSLRVAAAATVVDLAAANNNAERLAGTLAAMRDGADVIVQGAFADGAWNGRPDILRRVAQPSALGPWSYEVYDTKLARETKAGTILQLSLYSDLLAGAQGLLPDSFHVVTPTAGMNVEKYRVSDYLAYFRSVRDKLLLAVAIGDDALAAQNYPEPVEQCDVCRWRKTCSGQRRADDHLSLVAGISRGQRRELQDHGIDTLASLARASWPLPFKPRRDSLKSYDRVRDQARLQLASRDVAIPEFELLPVVEEKGLCRLPEPSPGDLFLDLEGDPFVGEAGREYLFGIVAADGTYESTWAVTDADEHRAFEAVIDRIVAAVRAHPDMHVYHYAPYEPAAFTRLMGRYATREREFEAMLRAGRFIDLYAVVRQSMRVGVERYSIKNLETLYGFTRDVTLDDANRRLRDVEYALESGVDSVPDEARSIVQGYNRDDCASTLALRDWLESVRAQQVRSGALIARPRRDPSDGKAPEKVDERAQQVDALRARLLAGVPETSGERNAEQRARWLLAYSLDYHRREDRVGWATHFRLCESPEEDLFDKAEAIAGLKFESRVEVVRRKKGGSPTGSVIDRYSFPPQETEIENGADLWLSDKKPFGEVVAIDRAAHTIDIKKGKARAELHPSAVCAYNHVSTDEIADALSRIGESVAQGGEGYGAALSLLRGEPPRLAGASFTSTIDESPPEKALRIVGALDRTVLPIQGPPGAGKTFLGARMICALVRAGKRVGVVANSHKVIRLLLDGVVDEAASSGTRVSAAHKCDDEQSDGVGCIDDNPDALRAIADGDVNVLGGTAWLWSREEFAGAVDVLFVDEAGQMSLANVLAVSQAANSVVLLGDPQQLEQPRKGSHPDGVEVSALEHVLGGGSHQTIPPDRGIFLRETWRLAPSICRFTSEVFYEGKLASLAGLDRQRVSGGGVDGFPDAGLVVVPVEHDGNRTSSPEEVDAVAVLIQRLAATGTTWTNADGDDSRLSGSDIVVAAPYNAHVTRLTARLTSTGVRVGTVDKFQGQQAPVAIYSMATSSADEAPRGMEFLLSLNRLNVATSRARCLAILVVSTRLLEIECRTPRQMRLANALCRFRELATPLVLR